MMQDGGLPRQARDKQQTEMGRGRKTVSVVGERGQDVGTQQLPPLVDAADEDGRTVRITETARIHYTVTLDISRLRCLPLISTV